MELTKNLIKLINSLSQKKYRTVNGCFAAEGTKCVRDTWDYFNCRMIIATQSWYETFGHSGHLGKIIIATRQQMEKISQFSTPSDVIAIYDIPQYVIDVNEIKDNLSIVLDNIQDPGNLGTIIRIADWFGIKNIICSTTTVDVYSHKVIQATMGAISRVKVHYCNLRDFLEDHRSMPVYGTYLDGDNIYSGQLSSTGLIVFGNEGKGISRDLSGFVTQRLLIPSYPPGTVTSESLNVGVAAAITIAEFRRRNTAKV